MGTDRMPTSKTLLNCVYAFLIGGAICCIGQLVGDAGTLCLSLDEKQRAAFTSIVMIFLGALFTGVGLYDKLAAHNEVHWHWEGGPGERVAAAHAKVYITSANGLAETGEVINIDGAGNRVAATLFGHEKVYFVIGRNKLAPTYEEALWRARNIAAPKNAQRLGKKTPCAIKGDRCYDCKSPDRICRGLVVLWGPSIGVETEIILVDQERGL